MTDHLDGAHDGSGVQRRRSGRTRLAATSVLVALGVLLGLSVTGPPVSAEGAAPPATGWVRLGHFAPAATPVDLAIDGKVIARGVAFRGVSDYLTVAAGPHVFTIETAGSSELATAPAPLVEIRASVEAGRAATIAAVATRTGLAGQVYDDALDPPPPGEARVRFIHASPDTAAVDIRVVGGPILARDVAYPEASPYETVPVGTYDVEIRSAPDDRKLVEVADWSAAAGTYSTVVVVRGLDGSPDVVPIADASGTAAMPVGGLATGFGGLAGPADSDPGIPVHGWTIALGLSALLALGLIGRARSSDRGLLRSATLLVVTGAGLGLVGCGQAREGRATAPPNSSIGASVATTPPTSATPAIPAPEPDDGAPVRSGANVNAPAAVGDPTTVIIPSIDVHSDLVRLGLAGDGTAEVPAEPALAGWFTGGPRPGAAGPAVISGHVDTKNGPAVFARLRELNPGDEVQVESATGTVTFRVDRTEQVAKDAFPSADVYGPAPGHQLRLITCGGTFDRSSGHYRDNVVVFLTEVPA